MKNRYTPFGYCVRNGKIVVVPNEVTVVQRVFSEYISGKSLKNIAASLTADKIEYLPEKWQWNKNRVVRIINDNRYLGNEIYNSIIDEITFKQAQNIKLLRNTQTEYVRDKVISSSVTPIICGKCGYPTHRIHDKRSKFKQKHVCTNPECRAEYLISDDEMVQMISRLLEEANLTLERTAASSDLLEIHRLEQELARTLEYPDIDVEKAQAMIFECANKKYQAISQGRENYDKLEHDLNNPQFKINRQTVMELVKQIKLIDDNNIQVTLINGQILGKEPHDGTGNSES